VKRDEDYHSYAYLDGDPAVRRFALAPEFGRVPPYALGLSAAEEARVRRLLAEAHVVSLHDHPIVRPADPAQFLAYRREGRDVTGFRGLAASGMDAVFDNLMDGTALITSSSGWKWRDVVYDLGMRLSDLAHQTLLFRAESAQDIRRAKAEGRIAWFASLEAATPIGNEVDRLDVLYGLGVRAVGIAYSESNALGSGLKERSDGGLTAFGRTALRRMNQLGMLVDVSHAGDRTSLETIRASQTPVAITHAGCRSVWPSRRMKPDEVLVACAERGGVIGLEAAPHTTLSREHPQHSLESVMDHFRYLVDLVGIDHVGFGPDTMFGDHVASHRVFSGPLSIDRAEDGAPDHPRVAYVAGMENPAENFFNVTGWLVQHGYSDGEIKAVVGENALRLLEQVLP
jgi:membrane dipeptidase